jgi:hypothetical protein
MTPETDPVRVNTVGELLDALAHIDRSTKILAWPLSEAQQSDLGLVPVVITYYPTDPDCSAFVELVPATSYGALFDPAEWTSHI